MNSKDDLPLDFLESAKKGSPERLEDLDPLGNAFLRRGEPGATSTANSIPFPPVEEDAVVPPVSQRAAPIAPRLIAGAADVLICTLLSAGSLLSSAAVAGRSPAPAAWIWAAAFAMLVSFILAVSSLALFGKTPGMALADLSARGPTGELPSFGNSAVRWLVSAVTAALAGIPLLVSFLNRGRRTPADWLSGFSVYRDDVESSR